MRAMPFREASHESVTIDCCRLNMNGHHRVIDTNPFVLTGWDYQSDLALTVDVSVDEHELLESSGLVDHGSLNNIQLALQIECASTGHRTLRMVEASKCSPTGSIEVSLPSREIAHEIRIQVVVVLGSSDTDAHDNRAAHLKGSRLRSVDTFFRVILEGDGSMFPTEAVNFVEAGFPANAVWFLKFNAEGLDEPMLGTVRLFVNTAHPKSQALLSGDDTVVMSVLRHGILEQMLLSIAAAHTPEDLVIGAEDSTGAVLDSLT